MKFQLILLSNPRLVIAWCRVSLFRNVATQRSCISSSLHGSIDPHLRVPRLTWSRSKLPYYEIQRVKAHQHSQLNPLSFINLDNLFHH